MDMQSDHFPDENHNVTEWLENDLKFLESYIT